jgi:hypothetical protein
MIFVPIMELCAGRQSVRKATRLASLVALSGIDMQLLPKSIRASPVDAQICDHPKIFLTSKISNLLFSNPTHKTKIGTLHRLRDYNSKPIRNKEQQSDHIYYTLL